MQEEIAISRGRERLLQAPEGPRAFLCVPAGTFQRRGLAASSFRFARAAAAPLERGPPQLERVVSSLVLSPRPVPPVQGRSSSSCLSYFRCFHVVAVVPPPHLLGTGRSTDPWSWFPFLSAIGRFLVDDLSRYADRATKRESDREIWRSRSRSADNIVVRTRDK